MTVTVNEDLVGAIAGKWAMVGGVEDDRALQAIHSAVREAFVTASTMLASPIPDVVIYDVKDCAPHTASAAAPREGREEDDRG